MLEIGSGLSAESFLHERLGEVLHEYGNVEWERYGSSLELVFEHPESVKALCTELALDLPDASVQIRVNEALRLEDVSFDYATQLNRVRRGALVIPGDSVLLIGCGAPGGALRLANAAETWFPNVRVVDIDSRTGKVTLAAPPALLNDVHTTLSNGREVNR